MASNHSGFRSGDSCVHQLLSITHDIYNIFDANLLLDERGVFVDLSRAFDRVWHDGRCIKQSVWVSVLPLMEVLRDETSLINFWNFHLNWLQNCFVGLENLVRFEY